VMAMSAPACALCPIVVDVEWMLEVTLPTA
jgi:hypothetical protein